jgi:hypothetical protein
MKTDSNSTPAQAITAALEKLVSPEQVARALSDALSATNTSRNGVVESDTRSRLQAASLILSYQIGRPVERSESINVNLDADAAMGIEERLRQSPALRATFRNLLEKVDQTHVIETDV